MAELCLGTVQFGMKYGINNSLGQPTLEDSILMLETAIENGISVIDTARAYGNAELVIGYFLQKHPEMKNEIKIISKLIPNVVEDNEDDVESVIRRKCEESLARLNLDILDGYLLHTPQYIYDSKIVKALRNLKRESLVNNIGVSIYDLEEGYKAIETNVIDYIQLPYSILDQRGLQTDFIEKAHQANITIFTRSAFLQGLYMMDRTKIPNYLSGVHTYLDKFDFLLKKYEVNRLDALIHFVKDEENIDYLVFGVDTQEQLLQNIKSAKEICIPKEFILEVKRTFTDTERSIIFPSLWANGRKAV